MEYIELVIKIPEEQYKTIKSDLYNTFTAQMKIWGLEAIRNGTPLPKGHGTLIDSDKLIDKWEKTTVRGRTEFDQVIMCEPSVIPAESEDNDADSD